MKLQTLINILYIIGLGILVVLIFYSDAISTGLKLSIGILCGIILVALVVMERIQKKKRNESS